MACKGICHRYKAKRLSPFKGRYESGQKRCSKCELFLNWDGTSCPCCGIILRTNPKNTQNRQRLFLVKQNS